jgi:hypothetical protein
MQWRARREARAFAHPNAERPAEQSHEQSSKLCDPELLPVICPTRLGKKPR